MAKNCIKALLEIKQRYAHASIAVVLWNLYTKSFVNIVVEWV